MRWACRSPEIIQFFEISLDHTLRRVHVPGVFRTKPIMALHIKLNVFFQIARKETEWEVRIWGRLKKYIFSQKTWICVYLSIV